MELSGRLVVVCFPYISGRENVQEIVNFVGSKNHAVNLSSMNFMLKLQTAFQRGLMSIKVQN